MSKKCKHKNPVYLSECGFCGGQDVHCDDCGAILCGRNGIIAQLKPSPSDLETPGGIKVDSGSTEDAKGPQIFRLQESISRLESDPVEKPAHYQWLPIEAIEITEHFNYCMGNALKYIIRADHKGKPVEDLRKAVYYIRRELKNRGYEDPV